jgi:uncharacterized protein
VSGSDNVELVRNVYEKLIGDDLSGFLRMCAEGAEVVYPSVEHLPWCGSWRGHEAIERWSDLHDEVDPVLDLRLDELVAGGDLVVALGSAQMRAVPTGADWETPYVHVFTFRDGKVQRFQAHFNTAAALQARGLVADGSATSSPRAGLAAAD